MIPAWKARCFFLILVVLTELTSSLSSPKNIPPTVGSRSLHQHTSRAEEMTSDPHTNLSHERVLQVIDNICSKEKNEVRDSLRDLHNLTVERVKDWNAVLEKAESQEKVHDVYIQNRTPWHFGLAIRDADQKENVIGFVTFYVAYSSWSGRILYLDRMQVDPGIMNGNIEIFLLQILAAISLELDCARLTWRHLTTPAWHSIGKNPPEMHGEVLTLSMDEDAMTSFVGGDVSNEPANVEVESRNESVQESISSCLDGMNRRGEASFRLRLAKEEDLQTIEGLVQGLADYVNESDAVELTAQDYLKDGFSVDDPLWHCVLIDRIDDNGDSHTCGYAFVYFGYVLGQGRFMYLEDLYVQSEYRGGGGGKMTMKALAAVGLAMKCSRMYWQALDWNRASLNFYEKIGAMIHDGEKTSRYAGDALKRFAEDRVMTGRLL